MASTCAGASRVAVGYDVTLSLCLVTLQYQLADLIAKTPPAKIIEILQKTWKKMSKAAHEHALALLFGG
jgi:hypothetical protein